MVALVSSALPVHGYAQGLNLTMTILDNIDIAKGNVRELRQDPLLRHHQLVGGRGSRAEEVLLAQPMPTRIGVASNMMKALGNAQRVMTIGIGAPPAYKDVTDAAVPYLLPQAVLPDAKP